MDSSMKILILIFAALSFCACEQITPADVLGIAFQSPAPQDSCQQVKFSGDAFWQLSGDSLKLDFFQGDLIGHLTATVESADSSKTVIGKFEGTFKAPLGQDSFTKSGSIILWGTLIEKGDENDLVLYVITGTDGFAGVTGFIVLNWLDTDERVYHGGKLCFKNI